MHRKGIISVAPREIDGPVVSAALRLEARRHAFRYCFLKDKLLGEVLTGLERACGGEVICCPSAETTHLSFSVT